MPLPLTRLPNVKPITALAATQSRGPGPLSSNTDFVIFTLGTTTIVMMAAIKMREGQWYKLEVSIKELSLDTTLRCGQSFRWKKLQNNW